jgi:hypothetical protein
VVGVAAERKVAPAGVGRIRTGAPAAPRGGRSRSPIPPSQGSRFQSASWSKCGRRGEWGKRRSSDQATNPVRPEKAQELLEGPRRMPDGEDELRVGFGTRPTRHRSAPTSQSLAARRGLPGVTSARPWPSRRRVLLSSSPWPESCHAARTTCHALSDVPPWPRGRWGRLPPARTTLFRHRIGLVRKKESVRMPGKPGRPTEHTLWWFRRDVSPPHTLVGVLCLSVLVASGRFPVTCPSPAR